MYWAVTTPFPIMSLDFPNFAQMNILKLSDDRHSKYCELPLLANVIISYSLLLCSEENLLAAYVAQVGKMRNEYKFWA
jgi:hypothetical protein